MRRFVSAAGVAALAALGLGVSPAEAAPGHPDAEVAGVAAAFGLTADQARAQLTAQDDAHRLAAAVPASVRERSAGQWFD
ncbi:hypothetical protein GTY80_35430, partial [Amycolatopsis sp. SID8362]|nr:hypothetical protein [Amycolatopsis sp. SID8362]NED45210.1 hypothetical protein [Amycolatopsis sp. SID8362]